MKKILILHTGGTIAMTEDKQTGSVSPRQSNPLHETLPSLSSFGEIIAEEVFHLPSPHITPQKMLLLGKLIHEKITKEHFDGVVITHGTDTLEETAYFLDLFLNTGIPVVVTGAMRSSNELGADGPYNLISSVKVAASNEAVNMGVLVVLNDEIHTAKNVTKTHTSNIATFQSPQYGPIGIVTKRGVSFHQKLLYRENYSIKEITKDVCLLKAYAGMDRRIFDAILSMNIDGVVVEAMGQGNMPPQTVPGIHALVEKGIPVVLVSRCFNGIVQDIYSYEGGGRHLKDLGVIFSNGLSGQKARIKLMMALESTDDFIELQNAFNN